MRDMPPVSRKRQREESETPFRPKKRPVPAPRHSLAPTAMSNAESEDPTSGTNSLLHALMSQNAANQSTRAQAEVMRAQAETESQAQRELLTEIHCFYKCSC